MSEAGSQPVRLGPRFERVVALTRPQRQIWTSQRLHREVPLANMGYLIGLDGPIDSDRFVRAFDLVVQACEVLRMNVNDSATGAQARIVVAPPRATEIIDLPRSDVAGWAEARIARPIDATECVYDSVLIRHGADEWTWWLDIHHVATDAAASALVYRATAAAYEFDDGRAERLDDVIDGNYFAGDSFAAVAPDSATERSTSARTEPAASIAPIAPYGPRDEHTTEVERLPVPLDEDLSRAVDAALDGPFRTISPSIGRLTLSAVAIAQAIHRLDGRREVVVGVPIHHRPRRSARRLVGPTMELYPLDVTIDPDDTHRSMFERVLASVMELLKRARPGESPDGGFEIVLNVFSESYEAFAGIPASVQWVRSDHVDPSHVIRSQMFGHGEPGTGWELDVNVGLGAGGSASRLPEHLAAVVSEIVGDVDAHPGTRPLAGPTELAELELLSPHPNERPAEAPVHEQVRARLLDAPDRVVAVHDDDSVTAEEFDRRADEVAAEFRALGLDVGRCIGLRMGRSIDVLVAIQAALRAGGAFVMLDPDDPPARHEVIRADADLVAIVDELPAPDTTTGYEPRTVSPDDLAYVLYTSGSTGVPKGVPITHRGLGDYLRFAVDTYVGDGPPPTVALHSALVFDLTITSIFLSFLTGGRVVVFPDDPVEALRSIARDDRIDTLKATPSQLELFTRLADSTRPLRTVIVGGEAFRRPVAERVLDSCADGVRIFNEYGPTEAVVGCMIHEWAPDIDAGPDVPIGHAAPGAEIMICDPSGHRAPVGAWGELLVRRPGLAAGYLNRPELTAERFVEIDGRRWYRTGDRARVERPGVATYGGRLDDQLKVGGVRLEPAEVESVLVSHPGISSAVVRVWSPLVAVPAAPQRCVRCGLGSDVPGVGFGADGVCTVCTSFDEIEPQTRQWFKTPADLDDRLVEARRRATGDIDCLHLLSGGKDSTYALYQLVERGWRVHALTLDTGFMSDGAKENVRRTVADLGITHEFATTDAMNEIFRDSLERYSNVCQGCYKTIYTFGVARARELGIPVVVTGLSRGQFFETRLIPHQFESGRFDPDEIDRTVLEARRVYHATPDAVTELVPEHRVFDDPSVLDEIEFLDFYRYVDVDLTALYRFLEDRAPWVRPADTGRSTNCLINVAGIHVHRQERGFHNYAEPYSWDVRLGHKTRDEALEELDDEIDLAEVDDLLAGVGYRPAPAEVLTAWYRSVDGERLDPDDLRAHLRRQLPEHAVPNAFVRIDEIPLAASAKVDVARLPAPTRFDRQGTERTAPANEIESRLCEIWAEILSMEAVGVTDDFFDLGGASLAALEAVAAIDAAYGTDLHDAAVFRARTIRELAPIVADAVGDPGAASELPVLDGRPLSPGEEAMLLEYRLAPSAPRYHVTRQYTITGDVDLGRLERAMREIVMVHQPLHTSYAADRHPLAPASAMSFDVVDLADLADPADPSGLDALIAEHRTVPFDLDEGPLVRVHAANRAAGETTLLIGMHHITVDAASFDLFWAQVAERYGGGGFPEPAHTYAEHGEWQRSRDDGDARSFWLDRAESRAASSPLAVAAPDPPERDDYITRPLDVSPADLHMAGATPFATAMAAVTVTQSTFSASDHVEFGIAASTREHADAAALVGYFANNVPVEFTIDHSATFRELVDEAGSTIADVLPHRTYPLAAITNDARAAGFRPPEFQVMLAIQDLSSPTLSDASVSQRILASEQSVADVTFIVLLHPELVEVGVEYRGSVVDATTAREMLRCFATVLADGVRSPAVPIRDLVDGFRSGDLVGPALSTTIADGVLQRFVSAVERTPVAPAVADATGSMSYAELAGLVAHVAGSIDATGVRPRRVGVALGRSVEQVAAIFGVLATGAAYVPLDSTVGHDRLERIVEVAGLDLLITSPDGPRLGVPDDRVLPIDGRVSADAGELRRRANAVRATDDAYVVFTSGSTGTPRGVAVTHANLAASNAARSPWYGRDPERFLLTSSIGFDSSVVGLFWPLTTGGSIVLPGDDDVHDVDRLAELIAEHSATHTLMVPSLYGALLERADSDALKSLRVAIVAGEACAAAVVERHERLVPEAELVNEYGPTEATVWATAHRLRSTDPFVAIGAPIPGVRARVTDPSGERVPAGVAGELLLAGPGVTAGYIDDEAATAAKFVGFGSERWYRTGDRVRAHTGVLEFVGRIDDQLNVGGVRIEPGDVERALRSLDGVVEAVVVASGSPPVLVAHVEGGVIDEAMWRSELAKALPTAAVPRWFVAHSDLPRTAHGKLDRRALAALPFDFGIETTGPDPVGSPGELVDVILAAWRHALARSDLDRDTDFFAVGGDSLSAVEIVTAVGERLGREVRIGTLLAGRTPAGMASALDTGAPVPLPADQFQATRLRPGQTDGPLVLMTPAWDDVFGYQALAESFPPEVEVVALTYEEPAEGHILTTVDELVTAFRPAADEIVAGRDRVLVLGWSVGGVVAAELADQLAGDGGVDLEVVLVDTFFPGQHRQLWSNRWWKYKSMLRPGTVGAALREFVRMGRRRLQGYVGRFGRALFVWSGGEVADTVERTSVGGFPVDALDHDIPAVRAPMLYFAATTTNPERTIRRWSEVATDIDIVSIPGRHRGLDSVMDAERVHRISDELMARFERRR